MPAFGTTSSPAMYPGDSYQLVNAADATAGSITNTQSVVGIQTGNLGSSVWTLTNTTTQSATVYVAAQDNPSAIGNYKALTDADTGTAVTCAGGSSISFTCFGPFICAHFGTSPSSGLLIIAR